VNEGNDLVLETLLRVRSEIHPELDEKLLRTIYAIQKKHQFDRTRGASAQAMNRAIEEYLDSGTGSPGSEG
jgi:hypothetical protein